MSFTQHLLANVERTGKILKRMGIIAHCGINRADIAVGGSQVRMVAIEQFLSYCQRLVKVVHGFRQVATGIIKCSQNIIGCGRIQMLDPQFLLNDFQ